MIPVAGAAEITAKFEQQREHLRGLLDEGVAALGEMADRRKALVYEVTTGGTGQHELEALERQMASKTTDCDRLRLSIDKIAGREQNELKAAAMNAAVKLKRDFDRQVVALAKANTAVADAAEVLAKAYTAATLAEDLTTNMADQLDLRLDQFNLAMMLPLVLLEHGVSVRVLAMDEKSRIFNVKAGRLNEGDALPSERLRGRRQVMPALRMRRTG